MNAILCLPFLMISPGYQTSGPPIKGHVLILDNDRTLEGEIEKVRSEEHTSELQSH